MTKKHKTGFTLVELLSVIVLLGIISVIIIPNFTGILKSSKEDLYNNQIEVIKTSAKLWTLNEDNKIVLSENTSWPYLITLGDLQDSGLLDELKNPKDDTYFSDSTLIYISVTDGTYTFTVDEDSINAGSNVITLNDERSYKVEINTSFTEPGYSASINGNDITSNVERKIYKNGVEVSSIDTTKISNYTIQYKVSYEGENGITERSIAIRRVKIVDTIPPVLVCSSCNGTIELESNNTDSYEFPTVTATDNSLEDIKVIKMGSFSSIIPGQKKIIYIATDSSGNTGRLEILINVKDTIAPVISDIAQSMDDSGSDTIFSYAVVATDSGSGIKEYSFDGGNTWQKSNKAKFVYSDDTTRTIMVKDNSGNVSSRQIVEFISKEYVFDYTGGEQTFTVPKTGYYKLEVWGAQGGSYNTTYLGGYGGYSVGIYNATAGEKLYINVGGAGKKGTAQSAVAGGYNGGGNAYGASNGKTIGSGGGATHIATKTGILSSLSSNLSNILIVAGGGGGSGYESNSFNGKGGSGGGIEGANSIPSNTTYAKGTGGSQSAAGTGQTSGSFGKGGSSTGDGTGGGGGLYGGGGGQYFNGAGGGSGYIGNSLLTDKVMYCYSCTSSSAAKTKTFSTTNVSATPTSNYAKSGNGYVKVTYIGKEKPLEANYDYEYTGGEQIFTAPKTGYYKLEVWGAQGGSYNTTYLGGYGGYSVGVYKASKGEQLYVNVGGAGKKGTAQSAISGGYNGGGNAYGASNGKTVGSGGGATHIATKPGVLSSLSSNLSNILIVAAGGGGAGYEDGSNNGKGGSGGGISGSTGTATGSYGVRSTGGKQSVAGTGQTSGSFGKGGSSTDDGTGGGGGLYGGGGGKYYGGAGGGSSYIGNYLLLNTNSVTKTMYCYNCEAASSFSTRTVSTTSVSSEAVSNYAKSGAGYARITFLSSNEIVKNFGVNDTEVYTYTNSEQIFTAPKSGYYKLEAWGAQGGSYNTTYFGGYGGYSVGVYKAIEGEQLYINIGGAGITGTAQSTIAGGYNGGGNAYGASNSKAVGSGGGATHIATKTGILSSLSSNLSNILIVAGGGGGSGYESNSFNGKGGSGGGIEGANSIPSNTTHAKGTGGSQSAAGTGQTSGSFGKGGSSTADGTGGGGGLYGGGGGQYFNGAGGGSGYIGNSLLTDKVMYCYSCTASTGAATKTISTTNVSATATSNYAKSGAGYVKLTYLGPAEN